MPYSSLVAPFAQILQRIVQVHRGTWLALAVAVIATLALAVWGVVVLLGWLWGQGQALTEVAPEAARTVIAQVETAVPGAREKLGEIVPALKPEPPPRDVSGTDIGPVARYPGLARSHWHREDREITVRYEGPAEYAAVLDHYVKAFAAQGYAQSVLSASADLEKHDYLKGDNRVTLTLAKLPKGKVKVTVIAVLPAPTF